MDARSENKKNLFVQLISIYCLLVICSISVASESIDPSILPGTISGDFSVDSGGAASYSIPIQVSPGTAGMQPAISLQYSSQSSVGPVGRGWTIGGL